jgi:prepilin-type N-terminal cleavage/methylation domain-containing protein
MAIRLHYFEREDGFTLIEMLIVMMIFIIVIIITSNAFNTVLTQSKKVTKSEESNIEGIIGLEMFRHDLEQAGFGLFTEIDNPPPVYAEAIGTRAATYNDSPSGIPRALVAGNNITGDAGVLDGTDYLAIKATTVARKQASQKWTYINGVSSSKIWGANDFVSTTDFVIATRQSYKNGELKRKLIYDLKNPTTFSVKYSVNAAAYTAPFGPPSDDVQYYYYGIYDNDTSNSPPPRAPFNRTDYFVKRTSGTPTSCATGAGVLYKTVMSQNDGSMSDIIPIIDCVADMQVVFGWDTSGNGLDTYTDADMSTISTSLTWTPSLSDTSDVRKHLKLIKVYILVQDGGKDMSYTNTDTAMPVGIAGEANTLAHTVDLTGPNYQNYRWKLYRIVVKPKNLI